jgi:hypothetical protein
METAKKIIEESEQMNAKIQATKEKIVSDMEVAEKRLQDLKEASLKPWLPSSLERRPS